MGVSIKTSLACTMALLSLTGSGPMDLIDSTNIDITAIPVREYDERVEGNNAIILADTPQELSYYIPDTGWREREMEVNEEVCTLSLATASESVADQAEQFLSGQKSTLNLSAGEFIVVELDGAHWISETEATLLGDGLVEIGITDATGTSRYQTNELTSSGRVIYEERTLCTYLKIQCPENVEFVQIKEFLVSGIPTLYQQIQRELPEDTVVLDERDEKNPVSVYRIPLRESVYRLADALLAGTAGLTEHEKIMIFMDFISEFYIGVDAHPNSELSCQSYISACGGYSNLLTALAGTQGIPARLLTLGNYPINNGHAVCEIYYDGAWHLYDPTYGAYYTDTPEDRSTPNVLSFEELSAGKANSTEITCVVITPERLTSQAAYSFLGPAIYEKANPKGILDGTTPLYYPLAISYDEGGAKIDSTQFDASHQGISVLGVAYICYMHNWKITNLNVGQTYQFIVSASSVMGEAGGDFLAAASAENATVIQNEQHLFSNDDPESMRWVIEFIAESDTVQITLSHDYQGPDYHYIRPESFQIVSGVAEE